MRLPTVVRTLGSGALFYVVMAACAASDRGGGFTADGGGPASALDAFVDGVASPVGEASAQNAPPDVATEPCNKKGTGDYAGYVYAVHEYPGKTIAELSAVRVVAHYAKAAHIVEGASFNHYATTALLRDGSAAITCGPASGPSIDSATFILPM
jgi:hypothetical protein